MPMRLQDNVFVRLAAYYAVVTGTILTVFRVFPSAAQIIAQERLRQLQGGPTEPVAVIAPGAELIPLLQAEAVVPVVFGMLGAFLLALPVAWVYLWTRPHEDYRKGFAQTLLVLPIGIALVVFLVKGSLALAFSLAGIVAAIRWRTSLNETMDAVFMFIIIGIGLAAGVQLLFVALIASIAFNAVALAVSRMDFPARPSVLTGWYLEGRAEGALSRVQRGTQPPSLQSTESLAPTRIRVYATDTDAARQRAELVLQAHAKSWEKTETTRSERGLPVLEFLVVLKKRSDPATVVRSIREIGEPNVERVEIV